jgi:hypothetical protein
MDLIAHNKIHKEESKRLLNAAQADARYARNHRGEEEKKEGCKVLGMLLGISQLCGVYYRVDPLPRFVLPWCILPLVYIYMEFEC